MFKIDSKVDKPDIQYMYNKALKLMVDGIKLGNVDELYNKFYSLQMEIKDEITREYGIVNPNSTAQVVNFMESLNDMEVYEICCIDGKWVSRKDNLESLSLLGYQFATDILSYRKMKKYAESIMSMKKAIAPSDGRVHPTVSLGKTNRINYSDPAIMNIPKQLLWHIIVPKKEGNSLYSIDIKNQEPSILINLLNIDKLKDALKADKGLYETMFTKPFTQRTKLTVYVTQGEEPRIVSAKEMAQSSKIPPVYYTPIRPSVDSVYIHDDKVKLLEVCNSITRIGEKPPLPKTIDIETESGAVYKADVVWDSITDKQLATQGMIEVEGEVLGIDIRCTGVIRKEFKQAWNAMTYGASIMGIRKMCKHLDGDTVYRYFSKIPEFKNYRANCTKLAQAGIQTINTMFGNQLYANVQDQNRLQRVLMDLPIQGTGADILSMLIKHFDEEIEKRGLSGDFSIYYTRHDELIVEVSKEYRETKGDNQVKDILRDILEHQIDDWEPFKVEIKAVEAEKLDILEEDDDIFE